MKPCVVADRMLSRRAVRPIGCGTSWSSHASCLSRTGRWEPKTVGNSPPSPTTQARWPPTRAFSPSTGTTRGPLLLLEVGRWEEQFLYLTSLATGVGSNALGLDRGNIQTAYLAHFERVGPKVMFVLDNPRFRAETDRTESLERSVEESFLTSTVGGFAVVAEEGERALVDATSFFLRDVVGVGARLQAANQGTYRLDASRSAVFLPRTRAFPENTEVEASPHLRDGPARRGDPAPCTRRQVHDPPSASLSRHAPRRWVRDSPFRSPHRRLRGSATTTSGKPFDDDYQTLLARRHRLVKADPSAEMSDPVEPIVYYLDPAVPEPYRTAFKIGRSLVEPGLRGGRLHRRIPRRRHAGRYGPDGCPVSRDPVGPPHRGRVLHRAFFHRSSDGVRSSRQP